MSTAKPRYDNGGDWKYPKFNEVEWDDLTKRLQEKLRPFYPDKNAVDDSTFGHPADGWANVLLNEANSAISVMLWLRLRLTNEELRAEQADVLATLKKAHFCLSNLSHDFDIMLGVDADIWGCRNKISDLIPRVESATAAIDRLPRANKIRDAQHDAAVEMAIRVGRILNGCGIPMSATGDAYFGYTSEAIQILKILGDEIGIVLAPLTWRDNIIEAKQSSPDIK